MTPDLEAALKSPDGWKVAMNSPIPEDASSEVLQLMQSMIVEWLGFCVNHNHDESVFEEIEAATVRLKGVTRRCLAARSFERREADANIEHDLATSWAEYQRRPH